MKLDPEESPPDVPLSLSDRPMEPISYSTWDVATHGPRPRPGWVVTELSAVDTELGVLKTGKEADVHLLNRARPGEDGVLLAAKRFRPSEHRMFHRDAGYTEGRRVRRSRETRAMAQRTEFGRELLAGQWAVAEFGALSALWRLGAPVPYPVQLHGTELLLEFIGNSDGVAAPRLAQCRPDRAELADLFKQAREAMHTLARAGYAHGDLSAYNMLVQDGQLWIIDLPQIVDIAANPRGDEFLQRDCVNVCTWFRARGYDAADPDLLFGDLMAEAVAGW
ncbi:RIO kinase 1 [Jatrophihabitans sp. GAS493]|uniref:serine protein kinase RIO n=1 Tax=Jatrophihabitans sp. GAS493 TaxID=1907575 RepID=UPI000BC08CBD|nr:RIO1 family regulatory kinase/ATPase [Jatrophihabitans sp. GAS493]SOD74028.1 RIO kinase 1 [Jatrophihabitans sp. GAS493]